MMVDWEKVGGVFVMQHSPSHAAIDMFSYDLAGSLLMSLFFLAVLNVSKWKRRERGSSKE